MVKRKSTETLAVIQPGLATEQTEDRQSVSKQTGLYFVLQTKGSNVRVPL
jgi:hypothetical protein